ncbi:MAG TPA: hypothetical protein VHS99_04390 [Chloroflexota bacterium]|nr:hypothetical protein [Chloroflexota bacterium]
MRPNTRLTYLLAGYLLARAALGALVNPPFNGPDEYGHWEYVRSLVETGGQQISGVEARQPPVYYALAAVPWLATQDAPLTARLFWLRLLSAGAGLAVLATVYLAARWLWPGRPLLAVLAAGIATLAPGHLYLLASVSNDPLAEAMAGVSLLAALRLSAPGATGRWWGLWLLSAGVALATKVTTAPAIGATVAVLLFRHRRLILERLGRRLVMLLVALAGAAGLAVYLTLLTRHPATSAAASYAHFWPQALTRGSVAYLTSAAGAAESFRTFWYAYDYAVRWPAALTWPLQAVSLGLTLLAAGGLASARFRAATRCTAAAALRLPAVLWAAAGLQIALVVARFGFANVLQIDLGGAAQAKAFFPAMLPLALLFTAGLAGVGSLVRSWVLRFSGARLTTGEGRAGKGSRSASGCRRGSLRVDRLLVASTLAAFLFLDWVSLAVTLWHHYRWWQLGS